MRKPLSRKFVDRLITAAYYARCSGIEIPMLEIPKIFDVGRTAYAEGVDLDDAIAAYVDRVRTN